MSLLGVELLGHSTGTSRTSSLSDYNAQLTSVPPSQTTCLGLCRKMARGVVVLLASCQHAVQDWAQAGKTYLLAAMWVQRPLQSCRVLGWSSGGSSVRPLQNCPCRVSGCSAIHSKVGACDPLRGGRLVYLLQALGLQRGRHRLHQVAVDDSKGYQVYRLYLF